MEVALKETAKRDVPFTVGQTDDGKSYIVAKFDNVSLTLFPVKAEPRGRAQLIMNANVILNLGDCRVKFKMMIKKLDNGNLLGGSRTNGGMVSVVNEYDMNTGSSWPRTEISSSTYDNIMAVVSAIHAEMTADEAAE